MLQLHQLIFACHAEARGICTYRLNRIKTVQVSDTTKTSKEPTARCKKQKLLYNACRIGQVKIYKIPRHPFKGWGLYKILRLPFRGRGP